MQEKSLEMLREQLNQKIKIKNSLIEKKAKLKTELENQKAFVGDYEIDNLKKEIEKLTIKKDNTEKVKSKYLQIVYRYKPKTFNSDTNCTINA